MEDGPGGFTLFFGVWLHAAQKVGIADDAGHGGFELMGKRTHKIIPLLDRKLQSFHFVLHGTGHLVKALAQDFKLIPGVHPGAQGIITRGNAGAGGGQHGQWVGQAAADKPDHHGSPGHHGSFQQEKALQAAVARGKNLRYIKGGYHHKAAQQIAAVGAGYIGAVLQNALAVLQAVYGIGFVLGGVSGCAEQPLGINPTGQIPCAPGGGGDKIIPAGIFAAAGLVQVVILHHAAQHGVHALFLLGGCAQAVHKAAVDQHRTAHGKKRGDDQQHDADKFLRKFHRKTRK